MKSDNSKKKNRYLRKYFTIVGSVVGSFLLIMSAFTGIYLKVSARPVYDPNKQYEIYDKKDSDNIINTSSNNTKKSEKDTEIEPINIPKRLNFLLVGVDENESLTDVIMVGSIQCDNGNVNILSIPRDTYVELENHKLKKLKQIGKSAPSVMKINAVNVYGGKEYGIEFLRSEIEELLSIKIDYYVKVDLEGFVSIVDTIGGVEFDVPKGGLYYTDPTQDLYINLKGGNQILNGKQAEGLVRFRKGYATQDLQRMKVQQDFIKQFVKQLMQKETIKSNFVGLVSNFFQYVKTDFNVADLVKYGSLADKISSDKITTATLPGEARMIEGASYFIQDTNETFDLVQQYFYGEEPKTEETETNETEQEY